MKELLALIVSLSMQLSALQAAAGNTVIVSPPTPQPGDAVFVTLGKNDLVATSSFNGQPAYFFTHQEVPRLAFAVPLGQKPGRYKLSLTLASGQTKEKEIMVIERTFPKVVLGIPEKLDLTPQALTQKLATEKKSLESTFASSSQKTLFQKPFGLPLYDNRRQGSPYGEIRQTGGSVIRHLGVDFTAAEGKPVAAMNDGVVVKAYTDTVYGNSVIIDHGGHLFSMYLHLQKMAVVAGDIIKQGQTIGTVGQTGYATAPHLHLTMKVGDISVDPLHFVRDFK